MLSSYREKLLSCPLVYNKRAPIALCIQLPLPSFLPICIIIPLIHVTKKYTERGVSKSPCQLTEKKPTFESHYEEGQLAHSVAPSSTHSFYDLNNALLKQVANSLPTFVWKSLTAGLFKKTQKKYFELLYSWF